MACSNTNTPRVYSRVRPQMGDPESIRPCCDQWMHDHAADSVRCGHPDMPRGVKLRIADDRSARRLVSAALVVERQDVREVGVDDVDQALVGLVVRGDDETATFFQRLASEVGDHASSAAAERYPCGVVNVVDE